MILLLPCGDRAAPHGEYRRNGTLISCRSRKFNAAAFLEGKTMRKTFKRTFSLLFASVFLAAGIVACGPAETSSSSGQSGTISEEHPHVLTHVSATAARCEKDGNIEYWRCDECGKYFSDGEGKTEISANEVVIPAAHKPESVTAVTAEEMFACDAIAHYRCSVCGKLFSDETCKTELSVDEIYEQKTFLLSSARVSVPESTSAVKATVSGGNYTLSVKETHFALRIFLGWEIGDESFSDLVEEMKKEHLEFRLNLNIDTEGTLAESQWYHFKLGYDEEGAFGGFSDSDAFVHFNLLPEGEAIEQAFVNNGGLYITIVRNGAQFIAYAEDMEGELFELVRTNCFGDTPMAKISLGVNQGFVAEEKYPAVAKDGKLVLGTADPYLPQTAEENPGDIIDEPAKPPVRELFIGTPYDPNEKFGWGTADFKIEQQGEISVINWAAGRAVWGKVWQEVSGYAAEEGQYLKLTFTLAQETEVYICYVADTSGAGETQMSRADYEVGEHTVYIALPKDPGTSFIIEYYLDAKLPTITEAGSMTLSEVSFVDKRPGDVEIGEIYDVSASLGLDRQYTVTAESGAVVVSWTAERDIWAKAWQNISGYKAENNGKYLKLTFTSEQKTKVGIYLSGGVTALLGHTEYEAGTHTVYIELPEEMTEDFVLEYYFDAGVSPLAAGSISFTEISFTAEKPTT